MSVAYFQSINVDVIVFLSQDWLRQQFVGLPSLLHNLTLGEQWLTQMAEAAEEVGITIQYCTASPRHALQSVMYPSVTQASKFAGVSKGHIYGSPIPKFLENKNFTHCFPGCSPEFYLTVSISLMLGYQCSSWNPFISTAVAKPKDSVKNKRNEEIQYLLLLDRELGKGFPIKWARVSLVPHYGFPRKGRESDTISSRKYL